MLYDSDQLTIIFSNLLILKMVLSVEIMQTAIEIDINEIKIASQ